MRSPVVALDALPAARWLAGVAAGALVVAFAITLLSATGDAAPRAAQGAVPADEPPRHVALRSARLRSVAPLPTVLHAPAPAPTAPPTAPTPAPEPAAPVPVVTPQPAATAAPTAPPAAAPPAPAPQPDFDSSETFDSSG